MPRSGGESGKLGNRYEAVWTVDSILDVLAGDAIGIVVEPFDPLESLGVEFKKEIPGGTEFHSAKRQTTAQLWSLAELLRPGKNGRSVLGDLIQKLRTDPSNKVVFVSGTTARDLEELCSGASASQNTATLAERLGSLSIDLRNEFENRLLRPVFNGDLQQAWLMLRRIRVVGWNESEMIRRVDQRIRGTLYSISGEACDPTAARCLLAEMVFDRFGQQIRREEIRAFLKEHGLAERNWARDRGIRELIETRNSAYTDHVEAELIANERIPRDEAEKAANALIQGDKRRVTFIGAAGLGKSCAVAQTLAHLLRENIPTLALRLDSQTDVITSRQLGKNLDLPESPVIVLAGIAEGRRCVLLLDQLDAISFASGRNQNLWDVVEELLREAQNYPGMRLLLACREFDAENDPRLRRLLADTADSLRLELGKLAPETVSKVLQDKAGIDPAALDSMHLDLLGNPLNLSLYLQSDPQTQPHFGSVQELLGRYWRHKRNRVTRRLNRESRWFDIVRLLVDRLNRSQKLSAARTLLDSIDEADIDAMASENVIVLDGDAVRFFHEAFFDYCCARIFAETGKSILEFLTEGGGEQHLFRRAQLRQILEYQREPNHSAYLRDLRDLMTDSRIRYHLKKLAIAWLGSLSTPREAEWRLLESLEPETSVGSVVTGVLWGHPNWATLLHRLGVWERWLASSDAGTVRMAVRMLSLSEVMKRCSIEIAGLFRPYVDGQKTWREEFVELFQFAELHRSREIFVLFLDAIRLRMIPLPGNDDWSRFDRLSQLQPAYAVELLGVALDLRAESKDQDNEEELSRYIDDDFITNLAQRGPEAFTRELLPRIIKELRQTDADDPHAWGTRSFLRHQNFRAHDESLALEQGLVTALCALGRESPAALDALTAQAEELPYEFIEAALLLAWSENGPRYAEKIVSYLMHDSKRLALDCPIWATISAGAPAACSATRSVSPHCSQESYERLEETILAFTPQYEKEHPKQLGHARMVLLECLPSDRISRKARLHFEELKRKFPWEKFDHSDRGVRGGFVGSPIPDKAVKPMTDRQWLGAMRKYATGRDRGADFMKGGKIELSRVLRQQAQADKPRFAQLALRMENKIAPEYFSEILSGITTTTLEAGETAKLPTTAQLPLDVSIVAKVIVRVHSLGSHECAKDICWAVRRIAEQGPSDEIIPIICHYAINDPDPETEQWQESVGGHATWGGDPHFHGMNSVRGAAAEALGALLFAEQKYFPYIEHAVLGVVHDRSIAVRSCAIVCLLAMLNFDRVRAVQLFLELCGNADRVLSTHYSEQFIYHATYDQYEALRTRLLRMLGDENDCSRAIASRQITRAALHNSRAAEDLKQVLRGDVTCRKAAAEIYAHNLKNAGGRSVSAERLAQLFDDPEKTVRGAAADCFRLLPSDQLAQEQGLMFRFIESKACLENSHQLLHAFEESLDPLPEVVCQLAEKLIAEHRASEPTQPTYSRSWAYRLPSLIARLYDQAPDDRVKSRCLDIIDGMLELGFAEIEKELAQVER